MSSSRLGRPSEQLAGEEGGRVRRNFVPTFEKDISSLEPSPGSFFSCPVVYCPSQERGKAPVVVRSSSRTWLPLWSKKWEPRDGDERESGMILPEAVVVGSLLAPETLTFETKSDWGVWQHLGRSREILKAFARLLGRVDIIQGLDGSSSLSRLAFPTTCTMLEDLHCSRSSTFPGRMSRTSSFNVACSGSISGWGL